LHNISEGSLEIFTKTEEEISYEELMNWLDIYKVMGLRSFAQYLTRELRDLH